MSDLTVLSLAALRSDLVLNASGMLGSGCGCGYRSVGVGLGAAGYGRVGGGLGPGGYGTGTVEAWLGIDVSE